MTLKLTQIACLLDLFLKNFDSSKATLATSGCLCSGDGITLLRQYIVLDSKLGTRQYVWGRGVPWREVGANTFFKDILKGPVLFFENIFQKNRPNKWGQYLFYPQNSLELHIYFKVHVNSVLILVFMVYMDHEKCDKNSIFSIFN